MSTTPRAAEAPARLPASPTFLATNLGAVALVLALVTALREGWVRVADPVLTLAAAYVVPVAVVEIAVHAVHRRASTGLAWDHPRPPDLRRVATKLLGLAGTLAPLAVAFWAFPEYRGSFYDPFYATLRRLAPGLAAATAAYVTALDGVQREPRDAAWQLGRWLLGHRADADGSVLADHFRTWVIKAYFLALFWVWLTRSTYNVLGYDLSGLSWSNLRAYDFAYTLLLYVDVLLATVGYVATFRVLDAHVRSAEPTALGWGVALVCYEPFMHGLFERQYLDYGGASFGAWLAPHPALRWAWAGAILALMGIYLLATVAFGLRFSNLTHRGIITGGPYRFTKHPAYVAKNLAWWLASVPFVLDAGLGRAVQRCVLLGAVNFIYAMRARTEERHLSRDPDYVAYALWMNDHGALRFARRLGLAYRPPRSEARGRREAFDGG